MKVFYNFSFPLDGAGTFINPAYKWMEIDMQDVCHNIEKAGECYYLMTSQGYVIKSIDPANVKRIELGCMVIDCSYNRNEAYPYQYVLTKNGEHCLKGGAKEFASILQTIKQHQ